MHDQPARFLGDLRYVKLRQRENGTKLGRSQHLQNFHEERLGYKNLEPIF